MILCKVSCPTGIRGYELADNEVKKVTQIPILKMQTVPYSDLYYYVKLHTRDK